MIKRVICADYPKLWMETELMADIPTAVHLWSNISFRTATKEDKEKIKSALSSEGSIHTNGDWAVRLKLNLFHSANLSRTSMYSKQIPYNSVLYNIFNRGSSADIPAISNPKQKKPVVVGKWCGKVWMSNQVHQLLAERDHEEQEQVNASQTFAEEQLPELRVMPENPSKRHTVELSSERSKSIGKRKIVANIEPASRGKSLKGKESFRATDHEQVKVSQTLAKQHPEPEVMPEKSSKSQTIDLSSESSRATLKRKSMTDIGLTSRGKSLIVEESVSATDRAPKNKCIIQYKRRNKLKEKEIQEETPRHGKNSDQGAKQFDVPTKDMSEGGPSTRLRQRIAKQAAQNDLEVIMDKVVAKTAYKKQTCSKRAKRTLGIQASATKRTKKLQEDAEYPCKIEGCRMNLASRQELALHEKNICSVKGCRKKFVLHKYLLQHQKVHLDDRPLKCPWKGCTKTFKWAWSRIEHIRVHTGARPYTCGETGCGKTFRFVSDFSRHKRNTGHSGKLEESATKGKNKTN